MRLQINRSTLELLNTILKEPKQSSKMHVISELNSLKKLQHAPQQFNPSSTNNYEVYLCALILYYLDYTEFGPKDLEHIAYASYLLNSVIAVDPSKTYTVNKNILTGLNRSGSFESLENYLCSRQLDTTEDLILRKISAPEVHKVPNHIKAVCLIQYSNLIILPKILKSLQSENEISFREHRTTTIDYFNHLANYFIPNLFAILSEGKIFTNYRVFGHLNKMLLNFPTALYPQIKEFIQKINDYTIENICTLTIEEIISAIKLNDYTEMMHDEKFLTKSEKETVVNTLIKRKHEIGRESIEMLMYMQYTIFLPQLEMFNAFFFEFDSCRETKQSVFEREQQLHYAESVIFKAIHEQLPKACKKNLSRNYICPHTGKQIDITYITETDIHPLKIAINIDGKDHHCYPGQDKENRKTTIRNTALKNAGWIVLCQHVPRMCEGFKDKISQGLQEEVAQLTAKLSAYTNQTSKKHARLSL